MYNINTPNNKPVADITSDSQLGPYTQVQKCSGEQQTWGQIRGLLSKEAPSCKLFASLWVVQMKTSSSIASRMC